MRISQTPPTLLSFILILLSNSHPVTAGPYPKNEFHDFGFGFLMDRGCDSYCGYDDQYCCSAGETCFTNAATIAECLTSAPGWAFYTTLTTETDLIVQTITLSSFTGAAATTTASNPETTIACQAALGESVCGAICCTSSQYCQQAGQCAPIGGTTAGVTTNPSAPVRGTSGASTITLTATTTRPFETPVGTGSGSSIGVTSSSTSHGLSGGAIAGIVIGTLAAIVLLIVICFCCILRSGFDAILAIFGLGPKRRQRREEVITTEERYTRRKAGSGGSAAATHRNWYGGASRPRKTTVVKEKRKDEGFGTLGWVGAGLLGLAAILGLKRQRDRKEVVRKEERVTRPERSDISSDYYSDYYTATTESKLC